MPGALADEPEHCHDCYRLIRPGQTYFLTIRQAVVCQDCVRTADAIRLSGGLAVKDGQDRLLVRRGSMALVAFPHQVRHRVDALVEAVGRLDGVDRVSRTMDTSEGVSFESLNR